MHSLHLKQLCYVNLDIAEFPQILNVRICMPENMRHETMSRPIELIFIHARKHAPHVIHTLSKQASHMSHVDTQ